MIEVIPIDFLGQQGALLEPKHVALHDMAVDYCRRELVGGDSVDLSRFAKCWIAVFSEDDEPKEVLGIMGYQMRVDVPIFRATDEEALAAMTERLSAYMADQGLRGQEIFIHVSKREKPEQRCPGWAEALKVWGASGADRFAVKVR